MLLVVAYNVEPINLFKCFLDLFCATERSNNIADSKFGVLSFSASKPSSAHCISSDSTVCGRSTIDFSSTHSAAAVAARAVLSEGGGSCRDPHPSSSCRGRLSVANQLLPQQTGSSSSLLPPLINIFTPITSFPLQLLSAAATPVAGANFNSASPTVGASVETTTNNFSLNHPCNPNPLNSLYPCDENLLCHHFRKEAIESSSNTNIINNNNNNLSSTQQTNQPSKLLYQQVSSSRSGSKADSQSFMSSRGRRPAHTQTTSDNQR